MYPADVTQLTALIAALIPLVLWALAAMQASLAKRAENHATRWKRIHDLAKILYNKDYEAGKWAQISAAYELSEMRGKQKAAAIAILSDAREAWARVPDMTDHIEICLRTLRG
jgi:hypothetical protein